MHIPIYWILDHDRIELHHDQGQRCWAWGWSSVSFEDARTMAVERATRASIRLASGDRPDRYDYHEHPLREEIVETIHGAGSDGSAGVVAVITRNRYGALVLNTASVCFVDIDFAKKQETGRGGSLRRALFGGRRDSVGEASMDKVVDAVRAWWGRQSNRSLRIYQTAAGVRLLFADRLYQPTSDEVTAMFEELGCDPLYRKLTVKQDCFRARLTPKPWRCRCDNPPHRYPYQTPDQESYIHKWRKKYDKKCQGFGVCRLVEVLGKVHASPDPTIRRIVELHDKHACCAPELPLA